MIFNGGDMRNLFLVLLMLSVSIACERRTKVRLEGGNPPTFVLSGSGRLGELIIFGPKQEPIAQRDPFDETNAVWKIAAMENDESGAAKVEELRALTYGIVPAGYKQITPIGKAAPPLVPGERYRYWFVTVNAPHASGYFEIRDGKAKSVDGP
jgi:hypothetical protein